MAPKQILWIDDDEDYVAALSPRLRREGWRVCFARSAEEGMAKATEQQPDLILMDVIMGGEHGFAATERLKAHQDLCNVPVLILSAVNSKWAQTAATREDALLTEANEFIDKSDAVDALIPAIRRHLASMPQ